jgi:hypothetical protein
VAADGGYASGMRDPECLTRPPASLLLLAVCTAHVLLPAQTEKSLPDLGPAANLPPDAPEHLAEIDRQGLRAHAYWLADDARRGRYTTSPAQKETAEYIADHFEQLGLIPLGDRKGYLQHYPLQAIELDRRCQLSFGNHKVSESLAVLGLDEGKLSLSGKFVDCGAGRADDYPASCKGRIPVVRLDAVPRGKGAGADLQAIQIYREIARQLSRRDAKAGVIALSPEAGAYANTLNYHALQPDHPKLQFGSGGQRRADLPLPLVIVAGDDSKALLAHVDKGPKSAGKIQLSVRSNPKAQGSNIVAMLEGTDKKQQAVVISAHHDHVGRRIDGDAFNGADDNASGTAGLLELAECFARGPRPRRSIIFLSVSGEELGLWGSAWFADNPTWPLDRIVANVNIDMIGRAEALGEGTGIQVTPSKDHEMYSSLVRRAAGLAAHLSVTLSSGDAYYQRSDHYNFAKNGIPVVFFCDGEHPDYHQVSDHADRLDYPRMETIARLAAWTAWAAAEADDKPTVLGRQANW